jgi:hypothetical protein
MLVYFKGFFGEGSALLVLVWSYYFADLLIDLEGLEVAFRLVGHVLAIFATIRVLTKGKKMKDGK